MTDENTENTIGNITPSDATKPIQEMNKDDLAAHAGMFGVEIDKRHKLEDLRKEVTRLVAKGGKKPEKDASEDLNKTRFVKNPKTGFIFPATLLLLKRTDLVWLDKQKKVIPRKEEAEVA